MSKKKNDDYNKELRLSKSILIVTSLQKRNDITARNHIVSYKKEIDWNPLNELMIDSEIWKYATEKMKYDPKLVFCHPDVLLHNAKTSLYYRGLCGLSQKATKEYVGDIKQYETGNAKSKLTYEKALDIARIYNTFICSIIKNSADWTLENGHRTIIATLGITLDGIMRNKIGQIAEERIKEVLINWLIDKNLIIQPELTIEQLREEIPRALLLKDNIIMRFSSEPDISFIKNEDLLAIIEIKGGTDPAGALERYGAAKKSFEHSIKQSHKCKNFYLGAVFTNELRKRISDDRLVEKEFDLIKILHNPKEKEHFFNEIFHHTLRIL